MARYYSLMSKRDLFGTVRLVRHPGNIEALQGRELAQDFPTEGVEALEHLAAAKRRWDIRIYEARQENPRAA